MDLKRIAPGFLLAALALIVMIAIRAADPPIFSAMRGAGFDTLQRLWPRQADETLPVRIIDIDEASLKKIGQWPWPRKTLADLVDKLSDLGASAIVFDIVFPEPDRVSPRQLINDPDFRKIASAAGAKTDDLDWPDSDAEFAAMLAGKPVVLAFANSTDSTSGEIPLKAGFALTGADALSAPLRLQGATHNLPMFEDAAAGLGGISLDLSSNQGVARQIPMLWSDGKRYYPSLVVEALRVAQGAGNVVVHGATDTENVLVSLSVGQFEVPLNEHGLFTLHYRHLTPDLYVPAAEVLNSTSSDSVKSRIEGNIVFVGTSATGLLDSRTTALGETIPGVAIHAQATEQILSGHFLQRPDWIVDAEYLGVGLVGMVIAWLCAAYRPAIPFAATGVAAVGTAAVSTMAFRNSGLLIDPTFPLLALILTFLTGIAWRLLVTDRDGRKMRRAFGHYVAPSVLAEIENNPQQLRLGGEVRDVTVMFVDIANFTPMSEALSAEELVQTVNGLWEACGHAILAHHGTIDKFIGDAVMAFWNAPVAVQAHQREAARAALAIRDALSRFNESEAVRGLFQQKHLSPIALRIGIASGPAAVGNMGSADRFDYSVLGDTVNTASRAETVCKRLGHDIAIAGLVAPETKSLALLLAGHLTLKGKSLVAPVHIVVGNEAIAASESFAAVQAEHQYFVKKLQAGPTRQPDTVLLQLADEVANRHPQLADYFKALPHRQSDFANGS